MFEIVLLVCLEVIVAGLVVVVSLSGAFVSIFVVGFIVLSVVFSPVVEDSIKQKILKI